MKLEKFKKHSIRNKKIIYSIIGIVVLIGGFILLKSFAFFESKYDFNMIKGRVPEFNGGDIQLAFTIDGVKSDSLFPNKGSIYAAKSVTCEKGVTAEWNNELWGLFNIDANEKEKISCNIDFGKSLYKVVKIGDYVSYTPSKTSYTIPKSLTGYSSDQTINPSELEVWRVIKKNEDGTIEMVSEYVSSTDVYFKGKVGWDNYFTTLDTIAKQYETNEIINSSRYLNYGAKNVLDVIIQSEDVNLLKASLKIEDLRAKRKGTETHVKYYSRYRFTYDYGGGFVSYYVPHISELGVPERWMFFRYKDGGMQEFVTNSAVRPYVVLNKTVFVNFGDGSSTSPYKIN